MISKKTWNYALVVISVMIITGVGTVYAAPIGTTFEELCEKKTSDDKTTIADFVCEVDIFQMKEDIEHVQSISLDSRIAMRDSFTIRANTVDFVIASCYEGMYVTNAGWTQISSNPDYVLRVISEFEYNDANWVIFLQNPSDSSVEVNVTFSCIGTSEYYPNTRNSMDIIQEVKSQFGE